MVLDKDKRADLKALQEQLSCSKLSFASEERLKKHLGLSRGSVTPLGILNDAQGMVELVFDRDLIGRRRLGVHPNENTATIWISFDNLKKISEAFHHPIQICLFIMERITFFRRCGSISALPDFFPALTRSGFPEKQANPGA